MGADDVLPLILGAGGVAFLGTVFSFIQSVRSSAESREAKAIGNLERWANTCQEDLTHEREVSGFYYRRAAVLEHLLLVHGIEVPECPPLPVKPEPRH